MSDIGLTGIAGLEAEMRDRLAAKDAALDHLRAVNAALVEALKTTRMQIAVRMAAKIALSDEKWLSIVNAALAKGEKT